MPIRFYFLVNFLAPVTFFLAALRAHVSRTTMLLATPGVGIERLTPSEHVAHRLPP